MQSENGNIGERMKRVYGLSMCIVALFLSACAKSEPEPCTQCRTKILTPEQMAATPFRDPAPKRILQEKQEDESHKRQKRYFFDDTPVGSATERDSGAFLNQQKRQMDIVREQLGH